MNSMHMKKKSMNICRWALDKREKKKKYEHLQMGSLGREISVIKPKNEKVVALSF